VYQLLTAVERSGACLTIPAQLRGELTILTESWYKSAVGRYRRVVYIDKKNKKLRLGKQIFWKSSESDFSNYNYS
jgi:hypothetical protein